MTKTGITTTSPYGAAVIVLNTATVIAVSLFIYTNSIYYVLIFILCCWLAVSIHETNIACTDRKWYNMCTGQKQLNCFCPVHKSSLAVSVQPPIKHSKLDAFSFPIVRSSFISFWHCIVGDQWTPSTVYLKYSILELVVWIVVGVLVAVLIVPLNDF